MTMASELAKAGFRYLGRSYQEMDCQKFVEQCLKDIGIRMDLPGSNAWYRKMSWVGTPEECRKRFGEVPPGAFLFILEHDGGERKRGYTDGLGNASHIGLCTGQGQGAIHSSQSRGGVFESSFRGKSINGGWNRVGLWNQLSYGEKVDRLLPGTGAPGTVQPAAAENETTSGAEREEVKTMQAVVSAANGGTVKLRNKATTQCGLYWDIPSGTPAELIQEGRIWCRIRALGKTGYMKREFLQFISDSGSQGDTGDPAEAEEQTAGSGQPVQAALAAEQTAEPSGGEVLIRLTPEQAGLLLSLADALRDQT